MHLSQIGLSIYILLSIKTRIETLPDNILNIAKQSIYILLSIKTRIETKMTLTQPKP